MTAKLFAHLRAARERLAGQLDRLNSGELQVLDVTCRPPVDVTSISIERVQELLDSTDEIMKIYGADRA